MKPWEGKHWEEQQKDQTRAQTVEKEKNGHQESFDDDILSSVVRDISDNHHKIIDDWCKAYLAQLHQEGIQIKPGNFTLNEQVPTVHIGKDCFVKKYWFEPGTPQFDDTKKVESFTSANWISLCNRIPEDWEDVLATDGKIVKEAHCFTDIDDITLWYISGDNPFDGVIAWMELPKPPGDE